MDNPTTDPLILLPDAGEDPSADLAAIVEGCRNDPEFFYNVVCGATLDEQQVPIVHSIQNERRTTMKGGNSTGKDFVIAREGVRFLIAHYPALVIFTAPGGRQAKEVTWAEFTDCVNSLSIDLGGEVMRSGIWDSGDPNHRALCFSTDDAQTMRGFHKSPNIFIGVTEAQGIGPEIWKGIKTLLTATGKVRLVLGGNPIPDPASEFYMSFEKNRGLYSCHTLDSRKASHCSMKFVEDVATEYGEGSDMWKIMVEGNFPASNKDSTIPLEWIEAAQKRWTEIPIHAVDALGIDVADQGSDESVMCEGRHDRFEIVHAHQGDDPMVTAGHAKARIKDSGMDPRFCRVDRSGVGAGTFARLKEQGMGIDGINFGAGPDGASKEKFKNKRAELYWNTRNRLRDGRMALDPNDGALAQELAVTQHKIDSAGRIQILPKEELKKMLGRSPDRADALVLAAWERVHLETMLTDPMERVKEIGRKGRRMQFEDYRSSRRDRLNPGRRRRGF